MSSSRDSTRRVAIACGGTGGHLFPGIAVGRELAQRGCAVTLYVSEREVDQQAVKTAREMEVVTLPAVGLQRCHPFRFGLGFLKSFRVARRSFRAHPPTAGLGMGGFTSAPLILAARRAGARTFLHESNTIPGRANRWLCRVVDHVFVGFPSTQNLLPRATVSVTGTPIRSEFQPQDAHVCRTTMGLDPNRPVVLVMGGSQGASAINRLVMDALPLCARSGPELQWLHLTGSRDEAPVRRAYVELGVKAAVFPFVSDMAKVMGAATVAVSRAGASALAEIAALCLPAVLVPYPSAAGNHQFYNALAFEQTGAARLLEQRRATPDGLVSLLLELVRTTALREPIQRALVRWQAPHAAQHIARIITESAA